ncbi:spermatogenesis-associated protein 13 isoform X1 [Hippocampus zosterae]|uniref:spermatogenesis-associated protein 13 isoform X1 n=2 Tax=Hippocampus zosterae TaxID=109293 RepID=UPI00223DA08D|nr:spermatogenesis-associated protein 13 isoform X1 [Hippocampus zosterae]XP_051910453.1 spermatogenesis-associated protein 13 isoform X1 [Hippocampus zosterae]
MSTAEPKDRVSSISEDSFPRLSSAGIVDPAIRSRPFSDSYLFHGQSERSLAPYLQPVTVGPAATDEGHPNGVGDSSSGKPSSSRIMRLFSSSRKGSFAATDSPAALPVLGMVDSFKKLRTSVLHGIQTRGASGLAPSSSREAENGHTLSAAAAEYPSKGNLTASRYDSDIDEDEDVAEGLQRNSRFSRSMRKAYGAGRITMSDMDEESHAAGCTDHKKAKINGQAENASNATVLSRLSKSADNLQVFKIPFRRKAPTPSPQPTPQRTTTSNGTPNIQRTSSASSVDLGSLRRSPVRVKGQMLKLMGSITDVNVLRRPSDSPSPGPPVPMSPLSRLHDDYSRRVPCRSTSERRRRPSPVRPRVLSAGHTPLVHAPLVHAPPKEDVATLQHQVSTEDGSLEIINCGFVSEDQLPPDDRKAEPQNEVTAEEQREEALQPDADSSETSSSTSALSPVFVPESPTSQPTEATAVKSRRRSGRPRPRPISDYGQLLSRKHCIPEEVGEVNPDERTHPLHPECIGNGVCESGDECGVNGNVPGKRQQRPISVMGVENLYTPDVDEDQLPSPLSRPPIPSHQVPPYKAVSARLRAPTLSQSTPIGLDRVGRRKLHRVLSDGVSKVSAALDDSVSEEEEEGSFDELADVTPYLEPGVELSVLVEWISSGHAVYAEALWDHVTMEEQELAFKAGDVIRILDASHKDWWWGRGPDKEAWFPSSFVRVRVNQEDSSAGSVESVDDQEDPAPRETHSSQHRQQMRTNVVQEIMNTERIYIKHLKDICEGYIRRCRKHPEMFNELQLNTIFSNIEDIYKFQRQFLRDLEKKYNKEQPHLSEIGSCFLLQGEGFSIYSEYCNTHPAASAELQRLMKSGRYKHFFESCRLLQQMIDISIAGFLLTPVQKICKYPLQLGELLKYTPKDHRDHGGVSDAYEAMKNVASLINEKKRRLESVDAIAHWQVAILRWEGPDVLVRSSELIHSGELTRILRQGKMQQRSFFLFDHQLVFCKKDVLRRDLLHYRGRLDMDLTEVLDIPDGRDPGLGLTLRNAVRLRHADTLEFVCVLCCRKLQDKERWLQAFSKERQRVKEDQEMGIEISEEQKKQSIVNARRAKQGKMNTVGYSGSVPPHHQNLHPLHQRHVTIPTSVPQQQVFALAEPPKRKPYQLLYSITRSAFFRK